MASRTLKEDDPLISSSIDPLRGEHTISSNVFEAAHFLRQVIHTAEGGNDSMLISQKVTYYKNNDGAKNIVVDRISLWSKNIVSNYVIFHIVRAVVWLLILLSFIEHPFWCRELDGGCEKTLSLEGPPSFPENESLNQKNVQYYPNYNIYWLGLQESFLYESVCIAILSIYLLLLIARDRFNIISFLNPSSDAFSVRLVFVFSVMASAYGLISQQTWGFESIFQSSLPLFLRITIFIALNDTIRDESRILLRIVPEVTNTLFLLLIVIVFFSWVGVILFADSAEGTEQFPTLFEGMFTLWVCFTTANYPDVMMKAYDEAGSIANLFFIPFMILAYFFFLNIILAVVSNSYSKLSDEYLEKDETEIEKKLEDAFALLDEKGNGYISMKTMMDLFDIFNNEFPDLRYIGKEEARLLFQILDELDNDVIDKEEFKQFGIVMLFEFSKDEPYETLMERHFPGIVRSGWFQSVTTYIQSDAMEFLVDFVLVLNALVLIVESYPQLSGQSSSENDVHTVWEGLETVFTILYLVEMTVKILTQGLRGYLSKGKNIFDAAITVLSVAASLYVYYPNDFSDKTLIQYVVMARVLRLFRIVIAVPQFQVMASTFVNLLPTAKRFLLLLLCLMYFFAAIGLQLFGGIVTRDPLNPLSSRLENTDFADAGYWRNTFNDMPSGLNVVFNLLVINNWTIQCDGIVSATGTKLCRFYFLAFHLIGVIIVNNVVVGFVLSKFVEEYEKRKSKTGSMKINFAADKFSPDLFGRFTVRLRHKKTGESVFQKLLKRSED